MSKIIFLNGCSSAGKTSIARAIQHLSDSPWLLIGVDAFIDMMPEKYTAFGPKADEGFKFIAGENSRGPTIEVKSGEFGRSFFETAPSVAQVFADRGFNTIIDEVLLDDESFIKRYADCLSNHTVYFVQVLCDLKSMQEREILRRDRTYGLSNAQYDIVPRKAELYDISVDTSKSSPFICAQTILELTDSPKKPKGLQQLVKVFKSSSEIISNIQQEV